MVPFAATSKQFHEAVIQSLEEAVVTFQLNGTMTYWNAAATRLFGWREVEAVRRSFAALFPRNVQADHERLLEAARRGQVASDIETEMVTESGSRIPVRMSVSPLREADGTVAGVVCVVRDRRHAAVTEDRFKVALEASPNAIIMLDGAGNVLLVNAETERLFGYPPGEMVGMPAERLLPQRLRGDYLAQRSGFIASPGRLTFGIDFDLSGSRKDGTEFPMEAVLNPTYVRDELRVIAGISDITRRKAAEATAIRERMTSSDSAAS
jgi:PAS domain S-box-containing protein